MISRQIMVKVFLCCLSLMLGAGSGAGGMVVCYGADGHVALEVICSATRQTDPSSGMQNDSDHCGPCADFLLASGAFSQAQKKISGLSPAAPVDTAFPLLSSPFTRLVRGQAAGPGRPDLQLASIVLRI